MAMRKFDIGLDPEMFSLKDTAMGKINDVLGSSGKNCDVFGQVASLVDNALAELGKISDAITGQIEGMMKELMSAVNGVYSKIEGWFNQLWDESGIGGIKDTITGFINDVNSAIDSVMSTIDGIMDDMMGAVDAMVASACGVVTGALQNLNASMVAQNPTLSTVAQAAKNVGGAATDVASSAARGAQAAGQSLLNTVIQTKVTGMVASVKSISSMTKVIKV